MRSDEIKAIFDQQASTYDERWEKTRPIRDALHFLLEAVLAGLPAEARILCIGVGTGEEIAHSQAASRSGPSSRWSPRAMLEACRDKAEKGGFASRCSFHEGYLESLPVQPPFDGATCFLVSQFILDPEARTDFFAGIAARLRPGGILASSDLASEVGSSSYEALLVAWLEMMRAAGIPAAGLEPMRAPTPGCGDLAPPGGVHHRVGDLTILCILPGRFDPWLFARRAMA